MAGVGDIPSDDGWVRLLLSSESTYSYYMYICCVLPELSPHNLLEGNRSGTSRNFLLRSPLLPAARFLPTTT